MPNTVRIPSRHVTYFPKAVFEDVLPQTYQRHSALVYAVMYDRAWHAKTKRFAATESDLAAWTGRDTRTVQNCLRELEMHGYVICRHRGTKRSRTDKPIWRVPHATFDMRRTAWVAVPRFLITSYLPTYPNAVLLSVLAYFHSLLNLNWAWPSVVKLYLTLHCWSQTRVYTALDVMSSKAKWNRLGTGLPRPLARKRIYNPTKKQWTQYYRVRCFVFGHSSKQPKRLLYLRPVFAKRFRIGAQMPRAVDVRRAQSPTRTLPHFRKVPHPSYGASRVVLGKSGESLPHFP